MVALFAKHCREESRKEYWETCLYACKIHIWTIKYTYLSYLSYSPLLLSSSGTATQIGRRMRLLNAETKQFAELFGQIPPYAILSHTWGANELSFKEIEQDGYTASPKQMVAGCCKQALEDGLEYVWIDTFCIGKSSSAELSEAINSMWAWYERAEIYYPYLSDVPPGTFIYDDDSAFCKSWWFTQGWTL